MKARIYIDGRFAGEAALALAMHPTRGIEERPKLSGRIVVALVDDHPLPGQRPLFIEGRLEGA